MNLWTTPKYISISNFDNSNTWVYQCNAIVHQQFNHLFQSTSRIRHPFGISCERNASLAHKVLICLFTFRELFLYWFARRTFCFFLPSTTTEFGEKCRRLFANEFYHLNGKSRLTPSHVVAKNRTIRSCSNFEETSRCVSRLIGCDIFWEILILGYIRKLGVFMMVP